MRDFAGQMLLEAKNPAGESEGKDADAQAYFDLLKNGLERAYGMAEAARSKMFDPSLEVEIRPAADVAARVEGIVGPPGIQNLIRSLEAEGNSREMIAHMVVRKIASGEVQLPQAAGLDPDSKEAKTARIEQGVRTGVGILTEGVLVAPTEGISKLSISQNPDGSDCLAIYFAGPIRSAGGTVAALAAVLADVARRECGIGDFRPTDTHV